MRSQKPYYNFVDGLRAVAVTSVVLYHAFPGVFPGGFVGVDIFFVISGFLISRLIVYGVEDGTYSYQEFLFRRIRRIFPAFIVVLIVCLILGWWVLLAGEYRQLAKHIVAGSFFSSNLVFWREAGYFDTASDLKPLLHLWSLGIEEQFYLIFPPLLVFLWKKQRGFTGIDVLWVLSFALNVVLTRSHPTAAFFLPVTRFWELLCGYQLNRIVGFGARSYRQRYFGFLGLLLIVLAIFSTDRHTGFPGWRALLPVLGAFLVLWGGQHDPLNRMILGQRVIRYIGLISYPLYLWHWPLLAFAKIQFGESLTPLLRTVLVVLSVLFAAVTYRGLELPLKGYAAKRVAGISVLLIVFVAVVAGLIWLMKGLPSRNSVLENNLASITDVVEQDPGCANWVPVKNLRYCRIFDASRGPTAALIGDSHANRLFSGLSSIFLDRGQNLLQIGGGGCLPFWNVDTGVDGDSNHCVEQMNAQLDWIARTDSIKTVVLLSQGPLYVEGRYLDKEDRRKPYLKDDAAPSDGAFPTIFRKGLLFTLNRLLSFGKKVIFVYDNPELDFDPRMCIQSRPILSQASIRTACSVPRVLIDQRELRYRKIVTEVLQQYPGVQVIDSQLAFCNERECLAKANGLLLYSDRNHLTSFGAKVLSDLFDKIGLF